MMNEQHAASARATNIRHLPNGHLHLNQTTTATNEVDMLVHSESAQIQEFRLYRELSREIEKNSNDRVRYVDSDVYLRHNHPQTTSQPLDLSGANNSQETQSATLNIGLSSPARQLFKTKSSEDERTSDGFHDDHTKHQRRRSEAPDTPHTHAGHHSKSHKANSALVSEEGHCQVCLIKGLRDDLTQVTKEIQERNEQLSSKLKARRLRTFFERQMLD